MSPRPPNPAVRTALLETAARVVATEGRAALSLRRLASEVGTSTMAIYTHFGSMDDLRHEVRLEGFARLRAAMASVEMSTDELADLGLLGWAYYTSATQSPHLYRAMFLDPDDPDDAGVGLDTFFVLVGGVQRCMDAGWFPMAVPFDAGEMSVEIWSLIHGLVALQLAHLLPPQQVVARFSSASRTLFLGWGADPRRLSQSGRRIVERIAASSAAGESAGVVA